MKIVRHSVGRFVVLSVAALTFGANFSLTSAQANEPGRGSDKDIKSAQGAALTNAQADKNDRAESQSVTNAADQRSELGNQKLPGRGSPAGIRSARGASKQNIQKEASQQATNQAQGVNPNALTNETKSADSNPGGMMTHFPPQ